jgi:hypothetical protein
MKLSNSEIRLALARQGQEFRPCDPNEIISQIGKMNLLAVSGGRSVAVQNAGGENVGVLLPCGESRAVEVVLGWLDIYAVRRVRLVTKGANRGTVVVEASHDDVFADELGEVVYSLSCWK